MFKSYGLSKDGLKVLKEIKDKSSRDGKSKVSSDSNINESSSMKSSVTEDFSSYEGSAHLESPITIKKLNQIL